MMAETEPHIPRASIKPPDNSKSSDIRKLPVAPDGYIPNSVIRSLAPLSKLASSCANRGLPIMAQIENATVRSPKQRRLLNNFLENCPLKEEQQYEEEAVIESAPEETNVTASLTLLHNESEETKSGVSLTRRAMPQSQFLLHNIQEIPQQMVDLQKDSSVDHLQVKDSSVDDLQTNAASVDLQTDSSADHLQVKDSSVDDLQTNAASVDLQTDSSADHLKVKDSSEDDLQTNAVSVDLQTDSSADDLQVKDSSVDDLQTNAASVQELKGEEDGETDQSFCEKSNDFPTEQSKKVKNTRFKLSEDVSTRLQEQLDEVHLGIKEQTKTETTNKTTHVPEIVAPKRIIRHSPLKKPKSFSPPLLGDRRPNPVLVYLYKRSKEDSAHEKGQVAPSSGLNCK